MNTNESRNFSERCKAQKKSESFYYRGQWWSGFTTITKFYSDQTEQFTQGGFYRSNIFSFFVAGDEKLTDKEAKEILTSVQ